MKTELQIRIDDSLKKAFDEACYKKGTNMSDALRAYIKKFVEDSEKRRGE